MFPQQHYEPPSAEFLYFALTSSVFFAFIFFSFAFYLLQALTVTLEIRRRNDLWISVC